MYMYSKFSQCKTLRQHDQLYSIVVYKCQTSKERLRIVFEYTSLLSSLYNSTLITPSNQ